MDNYHPSLCDKCKAIRIDDHVNSGHDAKLDNGDLILDLDEILLSYQREDSYPEFPALKQSADLGCGFCRLLRDGIIDKYGDEFDEIAKSQSDYRVTICKLKYVRSYTTVETYNNPAPGLFYLNALRVELEYKRTDSYKRLLLFHVFADKDGAMARYLRIHRKLPDQKALSPSNLNLIHQWIYECKSEHSGCQFEQNASMPARLLDLGSDVQEPHLLDTLGVQMTYIALSYCWGLPKTSFPQFRTEKSNLNSRMREIPIGQLPKTLQDAILVTRRLGQQFIWIDALCIIQDDKEDWEREAAKMQDIYKHSYLTIAAAFSSSSYDGFVEREPLLPSLKVEFQSAAHPEINSAFHLRKEVGNLVESSFAEVRSSVWNQRGWTFQERHLATRLLYFGKDCLHFECQTHRRMENCLAIYSSWSSPWQQILGVRDPSRSKVIDEREFYDAWYDIVETYSTRKLTFANDKLPAVSGMATGLKQALNAIGSHSEYLAGIWSRDLLRGLLWNCNRVFSDGLNPSASYRAPTWSWAAYDGAIEWSPGCILNRVIEPECQILDASVQLHGHNPMGNIRTSRIALTAKLERIDSIQAPELGANELEDVRLKHTFKRNGIEIGDCQLDVGSQEVKLHASAHESLWAMLLVASLPTTEDMESADPYSPFRWPVGLLLARTEDLGISPEEYRRIGMFIIFPRGKPEFFHASVPQNVILV